MDSVVQDFETAIGLLTKRTLLLHDINKGPPADVRDELIKYKRKTQEYEETMRQLGELFSPGRLGNHYYVSVEKIEQAMRKK